MNSITRQQLFSMAPAPVWRRVRNWWLEMVEQHCLISAEVERKKASDANRNASHFEKKAALIRANRWI